MNINNISTFVWFLAALEKKGCIEARPDALHGIRALDEDLPVVPIGQIGAAKSVRDRSRTVTWIPAAIASQFSPFPTYLAGVEDDAMDCLSLHEDDRVAVREPAETAAPAAHRQVVPARIGDQVVLRRYRQLEDGQVRLSPVYARRKCIELVLLLGAGCAIIGTRLNVACPRAEIQRLPQQERPRNNQPVRDHRSAPVSGSIKPNIGGSIRAVSDTPLHWQRRRGTVFAVRLFGRASAPSRCQLSARVGDW